MQPKLSKGPDGLSNFLLKQLANVLKGPLTVVINKSLSRGEFPDLLKLARVVPLFKAGEMELLDNYRPISLLPVMSKVLEKIVFQQLVEFLNINQVLYPRQYGFRRGHSTSDAVANLIGDVLKSFDDNLMVLSIFVDLRKAFDTVPHRLVWEKLEQIGVRDLELGWFKSYMSDRSQFVDLDGTQSDTQGCSDIGIAQGSLLGVLLFEIFINDLPKCLKHSQSILYADDTTIYVIGRSLKCLKMKLQKDLDHLNGWLSTNRLKLNVKKTKTLLFNKEGLFPNVELSINGYPLETVTSFRFFRDLC